MRRCWWMIARIEWIANVKWSGQHAQKNILLKRAQNHFFWVTNNKILLSSEPVSNCRKISASNVCRYLSFLEISSSLRFPRLAGIHFLSHYMAWVESSTYFATSFILTIVLLESTFASLVTCQCDVTCPTSSCSVGGLRGQHFL